jgi:hypothetical protein
MMDDEALLAHLDAIIKADSGWYAAYLNPGEGAQKDSLHLAPIIAWHIERAVDPDGPGFNVVPITPFGRPIGDDWAIKAPDGRFQAEGPYWWEDEAEVIEELRRRWDEPHQ